MNNHHASYFKLVVFSSRFNNSGAPTDPKPPSQEIAVESPFGGFLSLIDFEDCELLEILGYHTSLS